jgi:DNA repair exonuclease SbcCD ATPase subunit
MRIIRLQSNNFKRLKAVDITPDSNVVTISGPNEAGKTSVLDVIYDTLRHRAASKDIKQPIRTGESKAENTLDLGDYIVTRTYTDGNTTLKVTTPDGNIVKSPQTLLDGLYSDLTFDPWEFSRMKEKEQRDMLGDLLFKLTDGQVNLTDFDNQRNKLYEERTDQNREKKRLTTLLTNIRPPTDADPQEEQSAEELSKSVADGVAINGKINTLKERFAAEDNRIAKLREELEKVEEEHKNTQKELDDLTEAGGEIDVEFLQGQLREIESNNARAREVIQYIKIKKALSEIDTEVANLNAQMELLEIKKEEALEKAPLPVKGFSVTPDGVMVETPDGKVPFSQASAAQRLKISLGIAMANNPDLRVIRVADGSLLDDNSMKIISDMADKEDYQVWIEYASRNDQDRIGVYIEDGSVVEVVKPT